MKKINIILALFLTLVFASCEGFLDVKPSNQGDSASSIKTAADANVFMNGIMRKMSSGSYYGRNFILYGDVKGGDLAITSQGRGYDGLYTFNHSAESGSWSGYWSQMYHCLTQVNTLINNVAKIEAEGSEAERLAEFGAQALTLRGLIHFDLVRLYGQPYTQNKEALGVPVVTDLVDASAQPTRNTVAEVYAQVVKDLTDAQKSGALAKGTKDGFIGYWANLAIQARVYQTMGNHTEALKVAKEIIDAKKYTLYANDEWVDSWAEQFGSESIFEIAIFPDEGDMGTSSLGYLLRRYKDGSTKAMGWFMGSDYFITRLAQDKDDVRHGVMSFDEVSEDHMGACYKYAGGLSKGGDGKSSATAVNIKVIRLSEIYLIAAESALATGDKDNAAKYLQEIRKRSPNMAPATSANITLDMILDEKSKEMFGEGQRYFDMLRLGKKITFCDEMIQPAVEIIHRGKTIDTRDFYKCILPISKGEMDANTEIAKQQNPGY